MYNRYCTTGHKFLYGSNFQYLEFVNLQNFSANGIPGIQMVITITKSAKIFLLWLCNFE